MITPQGAKEIVGIGKNLTAIQDHEKMPGQRKQWTSHLSVYWLVPWFTYPRNETFIYQQVVLSVKTMNGLRIWSQTTTTGAQY